MDDLTDLHLYPMAITFITVAFIVVALSLALPRWSLKWSSPTLWIPTVIWWGDSSVTLLMLTEFPPLSGHHFKLNSLHQLSHCLMHSFGLARVCWLGHCSLQLNKLCTTDWVPPSPSVRACILFSPSQTQAESGVSVSVQMGRGGGSVSSLWETLLTERTIRPVCHRHSKDLFGLSLGKWRGVLRIDEMKL